MIDITNFLTEWKKIEAKVKQIAQLKNNKDVGQDFTGFKIYNNEIVYLSETYCCQETDWYYLVIPWDEINLPIEYFEQKFQRLIDEKEKQAKEQEKELCKKEYDEKYQKYLDLKKEFEDYEKDFRE